MQSWYEQYNGRRALLTPAQIRQPDGAVQRGYQVALDDGARLFIAAERHDEKTRITAATRVRSLLER